MTEMQRALEADGEKLRQLTGEDHGPFKLHDPIAGPRIQSLAILIAVELSKQGNELDNLGDGESVVCMGKHPRINLVQLAERIDAYREAKIMTLQRRIGNLEIQLELAQHDATDGADS